MDKDAQEARSHQIRYNKPLLVDGVSIAETEGETISDEEQKALLAGADLPPDAWNG